MSLSESRRNARSHSGGFTLIELLVVLVIIAATAGLVVPVVGMLGRSSDMAVTTANMSDLSNNLQQYFILQKRYPQGMDSLLHLGTDGTAATPALFLPVGFDSATSTLITTVGSVDTNNQISGLPKSGPDLHFCLTMGTLTSNQVRSLTRGGLDYVYDHQSYDPSAATVGEVNSNNSGKYRRALTGAATQNWALMRVPTTDTGSQDQANMTLLQRLIPAEVTGSTVGTRVYAPEVGTRIAAFGIGPNCRLVPTTSLNVPIYPGCDGKYYGRYIAWFKVFETGERAVLIGVTDSYGRTIDYGGQQFNESLPNGGRQG